MEGGRLEAGNVSVTSFPISESHTISTPEIVRSSNQEQFECRDCARVVSEEATVSFHYSRSISVATTLTTMVATSTTSQITAAPTSTPMIPTTVTVTAKESVPIDFALVSMVISIVAISAVALLAVLALRRRVKSA